MTPRPSSTPGGVAGPERAGSAGAAAGRLAWALRACQERGVRLTAARRAILQALAAARTPLNLDALAHDEALRNRCDATTVYRTLVLFCEAGVLRRLHLRSKASFFALNHPGDAHGHLVCRRCGAVQCLADKADLAPLAQLLAGRYGYTDIHHDLEFHGICPACRKALQVSPAVHKLSVRSPHPRRSRAAGSPE